MAIDLQQCISILEGGDWVSLSFVTADALRGTGGLVIELKKCRIARNRQPKTSTSKNEPTNIRSGVLGKDPNHRYHFTRNLELPNKTLVKVHPPLIFSINNQQVL
jgi:hypothetical protein